VLARQDDFAWLRLTAQVHGWGDFWHAMFTPLAQGTIRPWASAFFMGFTACSAWTRCRCVSACSHANRQPHSDPRVGERVTGPAPPALGGDFVDRQLGLITVMTWSSVTTRRCAVSFCWRSTSCSLYRNRREALLRAQWIVFLLGLGR
jgi:hypothetical protein